MVLPKTPEEREYGAVQSDKDRAAAVAPTTPQPTDPGGVASPEGAAMAAAEVMGGGPEPDDFAPQQPEGYTVNNPYMLLPTAANFPEGGKGEDWRTRLEDNQDYARFFRILASNEGSDPLLRILAESLEDY